MSKCECKELKYLQRACSPGWCPPPTPKDLMYRDMTQGVVYLDQSLGPNSYTFKKDPCAHYRRVNNSSAFRSRTGICPEGYVAGENNMCYPTTYNGQGFFYGCECDIRDQRVMKY